MKGVVVLFIGLGAIHLPNTIMTRPISFLWRVLLAVLIIYMCFVTFIYMLPLPHARAFFKAFDPELGKPLPEKLYAEDCRIFTPEHPTSYFANVLEVMDDCHFAAHFIGWWMKMLIMRDWYLAWVCSIIFEFLEITFAPWLPNFNECWWDSLLLDVFGCNLMGLLLGHYTLKYFGVTKLKWFRDDSEAT
jgi:phosphatidylserine synthase 2